MDKHYHIDSELVAVENIISGATEKARLPILGGFDIRDLHIAEITSRYVGSQLQLSVLSKKEKKFKRQIK